MSSLAEAYGVSIRTVYRYLELVPPAREAAAVAEQPKLARRLIEVPLELLDMGTNVRSERKARAHADYGLVASVREHGVLQPITVVRRGKRYEVLYGHRRTEAARAAGLRTIPAVLETTPRDKPLRQLVENEHRRRVDPMGIARALQAYRDEHPGATQAELALKVGRNQTWVNHHLKLLTLDAHDQERVTSGALGVGRAIKSAPRPAARTGRPRILQADDEEGRSRSVVVELHSGVGAIKGNPKATIGLEHGEGTIELLLEDGTGYGVMVTLDVRSAHLLARRLSQASQAAAAAVAS